MIDLSEKPISTFCIPLLNDRLDAAPISAQGCRNSRLPDLAKAHSQEKTVVLGSSTNMPYLSEFCPPAKPGPLRLAELTPTHPMTPWVLFILRDSGGTLGSYILCHRVVGLAAVTSEARLLEALLRNDFRAFVHKVFAPLAPGQTYVPTWHVLTPNRQQWRLVLAKIGLEFRMQRDVAPIVAAKIELHLVCAGASQVESRQSCPQGSSPDIPYNVRSKYV